ncbi:acyl carrier protein phosphodiesterase [Pseudomonas matsuisoli]|uniref:ACP phosphodiesterase n=1 Tax=Pseudomonas matsuisoli TaxID=1515666 RepID=A0A917PV26_9PSED|nr:ACP phosphodiesterase [Pseudomonas matsuisoli]GGJ92866.1 ACP phosphodiesterase [Pseudomonas matsuisoli]
MNYLAHLHLGGERPEQMLGSLYGDFVKGPLAGRWPVSIEYGIRLHRAIDAYTDSHPVVIAGKARFPRARRRFAGILLDVFFDHCLAKDWSRYGAEPLDAFTRRVYRVLADEPALPGRLAQVAPHMAREDWLGSYADFAVLETVIRGMSRRLSRPEWLAGSFTELENLYEPLCDDFQAFYPDLIAFAKAWVPPAASSG